ncbi:hypothetical protein B566_EDAN017370 [Ephemera danica]|nr:hypothetical protein B566_EDAN017370 [Ephemera danica]
MEKYLSKIYYDISNPAGYSTPYALWKASKKKYPIAKIKKWLQSQNTFTLHNQRKIKFKRQRYYVTNIGDLYQADLCDLQGNLRLELGFKEALPESVSVILYAEYREILEIDKNRDSYEVENEFYALLKSPCLFEHLAEKYKKTATWLTKNYHNLYWNEGVVQLNTFLDQLSFVSSSVETVYVKGCKKAKYIKNILQNPQIEIIDFKNGNKVSKNCEFNSLPYCKKHNVCFKKVCSRKNAYIILKNLRDEHEATACLPNNDK